MVNVLTGFGGLSNACGVAVVAAAPGEVGGFSQTCAALTARNAAAAEARYCVCYW